MPSSPIATRKTPAIFMITINRWVRGRFLIVGLSCLYVNRGALRGFSVTGGEALSVMPHRPRVFLLPRRVPRVAPPPTLLPLSVRASEGETSARAPRPWAAGQRASPPERGRPVSEATQARWAWRPREPQRLVSGPAVAGRRRHHASILHLEPVLCDHRDRIDRA